MNDARRVLMKMNRLRQPVVFLSRHSNNPDILRFFLLENKMMNVYETKCYSTPV